MLIIVNINVNNLDLDSVIQCLYLINNLQESLINLYIRVHVTKCYVLNRSNTTSPSRYAIFNPVAGPSGLTPESSFPANLLCGPWHPSCGSQVSRCYSLRGIYWLSLPLGGPHPTWGSVFFASRRLVYHRACQTANHHSHTFLDASFFDLHARCNCLLSGSSFRLTKVPITYHVHSPTIVEFCLGFLRSGVSSASCSVQTQWLVTNKFRTISFLRTRPRFGRTTHSCPPPLFDQSLWKSFLGTLKPLRRRILHRRSLFATLVWSGWVYLCKHWSSNSCQP